MAEAIVTMYLMGWTLTSAALSVWAARLRHGHRVGTVLLGALAGGIWPVLLLGAGQFAVVIAVSKAMHGRIWTGLAAEPGSTPAVVGAVSTRP